MILSPHDQARLTQIDDDIRNESVTEYTQADIIWLRGLLQDALDMTRDEWLGSIQDFLEARMKDAPDQSCKTFAENLWQETAEAELSEGSPD